VVRSEETTAVDEVTRPLPFVVILWKADVAGDAFTVANVNAMPAPEDVPVASPVADKFVAAVVRPLPLTVSTANWPTFELTVASVTGIEAAALPSKAVDVPVASPETEKVRPVASVVAVLALPDKAPTKVVEVTDVKPARVVAVPPNEIAVEPTVIVLFARYALVIAVPFQTPVVIVPTDVNDELTTLEARVVPVSVLAAPEAGVLQVGVAPVPAEVST